MPSKEEIISNFILIYDLKVDLNLDKTWNIAPENLKKKKKSHLRLPDLWLPHTEICLTETCTELFTYSLIAQKKYHNAN